MTLPVAILAGGLASRLRPITESIPKALVPVAGSAFIEHQLALLASQGYSRVVLCVGHLGEMIQAHLGDGASRGMQIEYAFDGPQLLGTGGALLRARPLLGDAFFVLYGDTYLPCDFRAVEQAFRDSLKPALMTVLRNDDKWDTSNTVFSDGRVLRYDKHARSPEMRYIDYGLGALKSDTLEGRPPHSPFDIGELYAKLAEQGELAGFQVHRRFYEIGSLQGLADAETYLKDHSALRQCP